MRRMDQVYSILYGRTIYKVVLLILLCTLSLHTIGTFSTVYGAGVVGTGTAASCTESALDTALSGGGLVTFNCGAAPVTIVITNTKGIASNTSIDGGNITISGGDAVRIFSVQNGVTFNINRLTLSHAYGTDSGGAIFNQGTLNVKNSTFSYNTVVQTTESYPVDGAAIFNAGIMTVEKSAFYNNTASHGGAVGNGNNFIGASATGTIVSSTFRDNHAFAGGAIRSNADLNITGSTFVGNTAGGNGGAIYNEPDYYGEVSKTVNITNSTFTRNSAGGYGSAVHTFLSNTVNIRNSTIASNTTTNVAAAISAHSGAMVNLYNTIIATNLVANCSNEGSTITDGGNNLQYGDSSCGATIPVADPRLGLLANNGGPTQTMALLAGSPAINAGNNVVCFASPVNNVDQRGVTRITATDLLCDIGAFEFKPKPPLVKLQYQAGDTASIVRFIKPYFKIINMGDTTIPLNQLTVRYWYTADSTQPQYHQCIYAGFGCVNITRRIVRLSAPRYKADHYIEFGFTSGAGSIAPRQSTGALLNWLSKANSYTYNQTNDYSFDSTCTTYRDYTRITLYWNGSLIWGTEPTLLHLTPTAPVMIPTNTPSAP